MKDGGGMSETSGVYRFDTGGGTMKVAFVRSKYVDNGSLALLMYYFDEDYGVYMPWSNVTVNMSDGMASDYLQYVDVNHLPGIVAFLGEMGIAEPTGHRCQPGFVSYPLMEFDRDFIDSLDVMDVESAYSVDVVEGSPSGKTTA